MKPLAHHLARPGRPVLPALALAALACAASACKPAAGETTPGPTPEDPVALADLARDRLKELHLEVCACRDRACVEPVLAAQRTWLLDSAPRLAHLDASVRTELAAAPSCDAGVVAEVLGELRSTKDKICTCEDAACVEDAEGVFMNWMMANIDRFRDVKPSEAQEEEADRIEKEMRACKERFEGAP
ncbi:MAG: hypothetical protein HS111_16765 [Kofleriaceae bacterium]|nr:hypothetical protein [Kofleriaceae bacterium]MCL4228882.1 hypothetical protein [Myxococcales bacterium]